MQFNPAETGDKGWLLLVVRMWFDGKKLYVDIIESNPPLILWIYALPVFMARHLRFLSEYQALVTLGFCATGACIGVAARVMALHPQFTGNPVRRAQFVLLLVFLFTFFIDAICFFDREHIFMMMVLPYILRFMPSLAFAPLTRGMKLVIGAMAGLGFCMKPHCLIVLAGIQLLYLLQQRDFRILWSIENRIIFLAIACYLWCVWYFTPDYIYVIFPMALATYGSYNIRTSSFMVSGLGAIGSFLIDFSGFRFREDSPWRRDIAYFAGICFFFLLYALANNGWYYVYKPLQDCILVCGLWLIWEYGWLQRLSLSKGLENPRYIHGRYACMIVMALCFVTVASSYMVMYATPCSDSAECRITREFQKTVNDRHAHAFGLLSTKVRPWVYIAEHTSAQWGTRFNTMWMLPQFVISDAAFASRHRWVLEYVTAALAEDLKRNTPEVVFVENSPQFYSTYTYVDVLKWMEEYPLFKDAWRPYRLGRIIDYCAHDVKPGATTGSDMAAGHGTACRFDVYYRNP